MKTMALVCTLALSLAVAGSSATAADPKTTVRRGIGNRIRTPISKGIVLNNYSSLRREWVILTDPQLPARIVGDGVVTTVFRPGERPFGWSYEYESVFRFETSEPIAAIEIRILVFDLWGAHVRTLSRTGIRDYAPGRYILGGTWPIHSEHECRVHHASIGYVARVRTKSGRVIDADPGPVVKEAKRLSAKFTEADLEPEKAGK